MTSVWIRKGVIGVYGFIVCFNYAIHRIPTVKPLVIFKDIGRKFFTYHI